MASEHQPRKGLLIKGDPIAATFQAEVQASLEKLGRKPKLVGILATSSAPSKFYAEFTRKQCERLGVEFILKKTGAAEDEDREEGIKKGEGEGVEEAIIEANEDDSIDGIMVHSRPLAGMSSRSYVPCLLTGLLSYLWGPAGLWHPLISFTAPLRTMNRRTTIYSRWAGRLVLCTTAKANTLKRSYLPSRMLKVSTSNFITTSTISQCRYDEGSSFAEVA